MSDPQQQVDQWLRKLQQESWQLELLVSAFTIFLLIGANEQYSSLLVDWQYEYNFSDSVLSFVYIFLSLLNLCIKALIVFLVMHLLLRGFWIGTIGLRSVQANVDFDQLRYSEYFTYRLKKKVISLDSLVIMLDEICSLMFSFAFLVISIIISFGLYLFFLGTVGFFLGSIASFLTGTTSTVFTIFSLILVLLIFVTGLIYVIDYFTLGFFKRFLWFSRIYYPIYRFYGFVTLSVISRSIYYYLISKFSKSRIRMVYLVAGTLLFFIYASDYDQYQYFSTSSDEYALSANHYDDQRSSDTNIGAVSIPSRIVKGDFLPLFVRYDPNDNNLARAACPDFTPTRDEGFNWSIRFVAEQGNFRITNPENEKDIPKLLECWSSIYRLVVNDSIRDAPFYYYTHPAKNQKGLMTMLSTETFVTGENTLEVRKLNSADSTSFDEWAVVRFWYAE